MMKKILVTGGAGGVATLIRPLLATTGREIVLVDIVAPGTALIDGETFVEASVTDLDAITAACAGVDLVVHLGGRAQETSWARILDTNINGAYVVLEAAHQAGVPRVLLASSVHAVGYHSAEDVLDVFEPNPNPDTFYGVSKVAVEALGRVYAKRFGMSVVSARMGTTEAAPSSARALSLWNSPADFVRLITAVGALNEPGGHVVWGVSNNSRRWVSLEAGLALGYEPVDDAETHAESLGNPAPLSLDTLLAGGFIDANHPLGGTG